MRVKITYRPDPRKPEDSTGPSYHFHNVEAVNPFGGCVEIVQRGSVGKDSKKITLLSFHEVEKVEYLDQSMTELGRRQAARRTKARRRRVRRLEARVAKELGITREEYVQARHDKARAKHKEETA